MQSRRGVPRLLIAVPGAALCAVLLTADPGHAADPPPHHLRIRVQSLVWWSLDGQGGRRDSTEFFDVAPGDDIDGPREYPGWGRFRPGAPFRLGRIMDAEHVWVHCTGGIVPVEYANADIDPDSVLVSTVDRWFTSRSDDGGIRFHLRIEVPEGAIAGPYGMQVSMRGLVAAGPEGFSARVRLARAIGIFELLATRSRSSRAAGGRPPVDLDIVPRELWKPGPLAVGSPLTLRVRGALSADGSWTPMPGMAPIRQGQDLLLFLTRGEAGAFEPSTDGGLALVAADGTVSSDFGAALPVTRVRDWVRMCGAQPLRSGHGVVAGRVLHAGSRRPIAGMTVGLQGDASTATAPDGGFELLDVPVGWYRLSVTDSLGEVSAPFEVTDQEADSVEVLVAQPGDPAPGTSDGTGDLRLHDVPPVPYATSAPESSKKREFRGSVPVDARIDALGRVVDAAAMDVNSGAPPAIRRAAERCVRNWKFRPALRDGRPVEGRTSFAVRFDRVTPDAGH